MSASGGLDKIGITLGRFFQRQMDIADMALVRSEFVRTARLARLAGFDAVELHMGHGYLLNQFISPLSNHRKDEYGGTAAKRATYPAEVLKAVKDEVGSELAVLAKINLFDAARGGANVGDAIVTAGLLEEAGCDMLVLSGGRNLESPWAIFNGSLPFDAMKETQRGLKNAIQFSLLKAMTPKSLHFSELYFLEAAREVRQAVTMKLAYVGGVLSLAAAQAVIEDGFDAVVMARALIHDPSLINRFRVAPGHRSACDSCNRCVAAMYSANGTYCVVMENAIPAQFNQVAANAT